MLYHTFTAIPPEPPKFFFVTSENEKILSLTGLKKELLQAEFDKEGLNLIATYRDVTSCPPVREQFHKKIRKAKGHRFRRFTKTV